MTKPQNAAAAEVRQDSDRKFISLTQEDLDRGLTPEQRDELRAMLNVHGFLRELQRTGVLSFDKAQE